MADVEGLPPAASGRAARSPERDLSRSSAPGQTGKRRASRRNSSQNNDLKAAAAVPQPESATVTARGRTGLPPVVPPLAQAGASPTAGTPLTTTRILARPSPDTEHADTNTSALPASPGGPPPDGDHPTGMAARAQVATTTTIAFRNAFDAKKWSSGSLVSHGADTTSHA